MWMQPDRFRLLLTSRGPYGSVYFDDSHDTEDAYTQIELKWRALREQLEQQGAEPALTESVEAAIAASRPAVGAVEKLIIGDIGDATVVAGDDLATVAPNENVLSEWERRRRRCCAPMKRCRCWPFRLRRHWSGLTNASLRETVWRRCCATRCAELLGQLGDQRVVDLLTQLKRVLENGLRPCLFELAA